MACTAQTRARCGGTARCSAAARHVHALPAGRQVYLIAHNPASPALPLRICPLRPSLTSCCLCAYFVCCPGFSPPHPPTSTHLPAPLSPHHRQVPEAVCLPAMTCRAAWAPHACTIQTHIPAHTRIAATSPPYHWQVPEAVCLPSMTYHEAWELSYFGANVLHPRTTLPAMKYHIPITIRNFFNQRAPGAANSHACSHAGAGGGVQWQVRAWRCSSVPAPLPPKLKVNGLHLCPRSPPPHTHARVRYPPPPLSLKRRHARCGPGAGPGGLQGQGAVHVRYTCGTHAHGYSARCIRMRCTCPWVMWCSAASCGTAMSGAVGEGRPLGRRAVPALLGAARTWDVVGLAGRLAAVTQVPSHAWGHGPGRSPYLPPACLPCAPCLKGTSICNMQHAVPACHPPPARLALASLPSPAPAPSPLYPPPLPPCR